ncbi:LOW QUALITY PROTEIN: polycystic kidney disease 2-like 1 protein [Octopus sinensis]|uniref:LOW QUALITY PROTEIN: polycystic kidney disease 2-like 1 protein n=1 Tax=Octopus sinensis TaxID=2607531 RepID=A0A6P7TTG7_9MOLL|nr:LOW QUALITY PROTEIN: polycystic kidney disease 2-like 1 protein [Octopus sinensis]
MEGLFEDKLYNQRPLTESEKGYILSENVLIGLARLRQLRRQNYSCAGRAGFWSYFENCLQEYSLSSENRQPFGLQKETAFVSVNKNRWIYQTSEILGGLATSGTIVKFSGGGYVQDLSSTKVESMKLITSLEKNSWIDRLTAGVLIEFTIYNANINLFSAAVFDDLVAINLFVIWIKVFPKLSAVFKYVSFNKTLAQFSETISRGAKDIVGFFAMFFIVFGAFAQLAYLLFGSKLETFKFTQFRVILGDFNYYELESANRVLGPIYFFLYVFFVFYILLNMFLAIINDSYQEVKDESGDKTNDFEIGKLIRQVLNSLLTCRNTANSSVAFRTGPITCST